MKFISNTRSINIYQKERKAYNTISLRDWFLYSISDRYKTIEQVRKWF